MSFYSVVFLSSLTSYRLEKAEWNIINSTRASICRCRTVGIPFRTTKVENKTRLIQKETGRFNRELLFSDPPYISLLPGSRCPGTSGPFETGASIRAGALTRLHPAFIKSDNNLNCAEAVLIIRRKKERVLGARGEEKPSSRKNVKFIVKYVCNMCPTS